MLNNNNSDSSYEDNKTDRAPSQQALIVKDNDPQLFQLNKPSSTAARQSCGIKSSFITLLVTLGKLLYSVGQQYFNNSLGNKYVDPPKKVNQALIYLFIASSLTILATTRVHSVYKKVNKYFNPAHQQSNTPSSYKPSSQAAAFFYHILRGFGLSSSLYSALGALLSTMMALTHWEHPHSRAVVNADNVTISPLSEAISAYVVLSSTITFLSFKMPKIRDNAQDIAEFLTQSHDNDSQQLQPSSKCYKLKMGCVYSLIGLYTTSYSILSKVGTKQSLLILSRMLSNDEPEGAGLVAINAISWGSLISAMIMASSTAGRELYHIAQSFFDQNSEQAKRITFKPQNSNCLNNTLFYTLIGAGLIHIYANFMGVLGSMSHTLEKEIGLDSDISETFGWVFAVGSILPFAALNLLEMLRRVFSIENQQQPRDDYFKLPEVEDSPEATNGSVNGQLTTPQTHPGRIHREHFSMYDHDFDDRRERSRTFDITSLC